MNPIEMLKQGIEGGNWSNICTAYKLLTGEEIEPQEANSTAVNLQAIENYAVQILEEVSPGMELESSPNINPEPKQDDKSVVEVEPQKHQEEDLSDCIVKETILKEEKDNFVGAKTKVNTQEYSDEEKAKKRIEANKIMAENARARKSKRTRKEVQVKCTRCDTEFKTFDASNKRCKPCLTELAGQIPGR